ncbi:hypothetical protein [Streptomyces tropicalis]|uniref:Secreted protein n=1 Tax=Streptomyces tropicalis TaxID=3034234 RepID=A0ABT6A3V6_9ACTN|nr:hypothetical protein [Streptomyces tropicalis]MDF3299326.1 hypothetical protein [Streptomyces tropicalis]
MKKRSMLALASLATGFVVAAVSPSHAAGHPLGDPDVKDTVGTVDHLVGHDSPVAADDDTRGNRA